MCTKCAHKWPSSYKIEWESETKLKETRKSATLAAVVNPHTLDQSRRELVNFSRSWSIEHCVSSKILLLRSSHTIHIKQRGAKFQISEWCFPNQLHHPKNKSFTIRGTTQVTWNERKRKLHSTYFRTNKCYFRIIGAEISNLGAQNTSKIDISRPIVWK